MKRLRPRRSMAVLLTAAGIGAAAPAAALEIFGIRLWGQGAEEDAFEIIDPLPYTAEVVVEGGDGDLAGALERASALYSDQDRPASGRGGLLARAKGDYRRILAALYDSAYYGGEISIRLAGREAADLTLDSPLPPEVPAVIVVRPGPRFRFGQAGIVNAPPLDVGENDIVENELAERFATGEPANAPVVAAASSTAVERWRQLGRAKAREVERSVTADHATERLDVVLTLEPGRAADYGQTRVRGTQRMNPGFVAYMADLPEGESFDPDRIRAAEERLSRLGVFSAVRVEEAEAIAPDGSLHMTVVVEERRRRTIGFGGTISTIEGLGVEAFWEHRNLFGRAERLRFSASVTGLGVTGDAGDFDYTAGVSFLKPGVINSSTDAIASILARRLDLDAYREESITGKVGLQRTFARGLNGELSFVASKARYDDFFGTRDFLILGPLARGDYDRRDNALDPTRGYFLAAELNPFYELEGGNIAARGTLEGRVYRGFGPEARFVLAARAKVGSYLGPSIRESPPDQLFFAGGAGSIRGYAFRSIGIKATNDDGETGTVGGRSLVEGSGEARLRFGPRFGAVGFVDAGYVSSASNFASGENDVRVGAGVGVRYFTGLGPLRIDVATPLTRRDDDDIVAVYIGIGQAF